MPWFTQYLFICVDILCQAKYWFVSNRANEEEKAGQRGSTGAKGYTLHLLSTAQRNIVVKELVLQPPSTHFKSLPQHISP